MGQHTSITSCLAEVPDICRGSGVGMLRRVEWETQDWARLRGPEQEKVAIPLTGQKKEVRRWVWKEPAKRVLWMDLQMSLVKEKSEGFL